MPSRTGPRACTTAAAVGPHAAGAAAPAPRPCAWRLHATRAHAVARAGVHAHARAVPSTAWPCPCRPHPAAGRGVCGGVQRQRHRPGRVAGLRERAQGRLLRGGWRAHPSGGGLGGGCSHSAAGGCCSSRRRSALIDPLPLPRTRAPGQVPLPRRARRDGQARAHPPRAHLGRRCLALHRARADLGRRRGGRGWGGPNGRHGAAPTGCAAAGP
jgi:hypothetical protein